MASTSEKTFGNKLEHTRTLQITANKITDYAPSNTALTDANVTTFLDSVEAKNGEVANVKQVLSDKRTTLRIKVFGDAKQGLGGAITLAGRVRDYVGSLPGGKSSPHYKRIQKLVQRITNYHRPRKAVSGEPPSTDAQKKEISRSEASYGSIAQACRDLAESVETVPGYNPSGAGLNDLKPAALKATMKTIADHNGDVAGALADAGKVVAERLKMYEAKDISVSAIFQQIKAAVAGQFGRRSAEYKSISGIRY